MTKYKIDDVILNSTEEMHQYVIDNYSGDIADEELDTMFSKRWDSEQEKYISYSEWLMKFNYEYYQIQKDRFVKRFLNFANDAFESGYEYAKTYPESSINLVIYKIS